MIVIEKVKIYGVKVGSIAQELEIRNGDYLISINGNEIIDILDYKFNEADNYIELEIEHENGEVEIYEIEKDESEELGLIFENELIDNPRNCYNKCIFCFMEQLPDNVRDSLIFKDDDYRLSFFSGNYITLTNMKENDINRIIKYRLSPINISVHATDEKVRSMMLNNRHAGKVLKYIDMLYDAGISMNTQIVLCKGINDRDILEKTIKDLSKYAPVLKSICIVPVGLSQNRDGLYPLVPLEVEDCVYTINLISKYQEEFKKKFGTPLVFVADEIYIRAGAKVPKHSDYGEFGQIEDGIGMVSNFDFEFKKAINRLKKKIEKENIDTSNIRRKVTIITGKIVEDYIKEKANKVIKIFQNIEVNVVAPINNYFGKDITVTGLVTGRDIKATLLEKISNGESIGEYIIIPRVMLKEDQDIFLDDTLLVDLSNDLDSKFVVSDGGAESFIDAIIMDTPEKKITKLYDENVLPGHSYENSIK